MDKQQIIEGNEAIAKFMGLEQHEASLDGTLNAWADHSIGWTGLGMHLRYHEDWNWLMKPISLIAINSSGEAHNAYMKYRDKLACADIEGVWQVVVEFVNQQQHGT